MIFENLKKRDNYIVNLDSYYNNNEIIENNNNNYNSNISSNYIYNNNQLLINDNLNEFIKEKSYKDITNKEIKDNIFFFSSYLNSCKKYNNISSLYKDLKIIFKSEIEKEDYYSNIIYNYFNNILELVSEKGFFLGINNTVYLYKTLKKIEKHIKLNDNSYDEIKKEIIQVQKQIINILEKFNNFEYIVKCINSLNNIIKYIEDIDNKITQYKNNKIYENKSKNNSIKSFSNNNKINLKNENLDFENNDETHNEKIIIDFDTYKYKNYNNISNSSNIYENNINEISIKDNFSKLNKAQFIEDNSISNTDYCSKKDKIILNIKNKIAIENKKKNINTNKLEKDFDKEDEKIKKQISYNYENLMCPPIKSDSD